VAPGERVAALDSSNTLRSVNGTSYAAPHVAGLIALQLQYARQYGILANTGYHREVMKHGAVGLGREALWQGAGKLWAAATHPGDFRKGSLDLMALYWPIRYDIGFSDYAYVIEGVPVFYAGTRMQQHIALTNMTNILGNTNERIEDLSIKVMQSEIAEPQESNVNPPAVQWLPIVPLLDSGAAASVNLPNSYLIPQDLAGELSRTVVKLAFNFVGSSTAIEVTYTQGQSLWYAATPGDLNLDRTVDADDFAHFARYWQHDEGDTDQAWRRADLNQDRTVDWRDLAVVASHWLRTQGIPVP
jgi:subtilisin family serine protease